MVYADILEILRLVSNDKYVRLSATVVISFCGALCFAFR